MLGVNVFGPDTFWVASRTTMIKGPSRIIATARIFPISYSINLFMRLNDDLVKIILPGKYSWSCEYKFLWNCEGYYAGNKVVAFVRRMLILVESRRLVNTTLVFSPFSLLKLVPHPYFLNLRCSQAGMEQESLSVGRLRCKKAFGSSLKKIQETTIIPQSFGFLFCMQPQVPTLRIIRFCLYMKAL